MGDMDIQGQSIREHKASLHALAFVVAYEGAFVDALTGALVGTYVDAFGDA